MHIAHQVLTNRSIELLISHLSLPKRFSKTIRVRYTAVKNEQTIPIIHVVAKPRIGPVPVTRRIIPVMSDVKLESKIAEKALL